MKVLTELELADTVPTPLSDIPAVRQAMDRYAVAVSYLLQCLAPQESVHLDAGQGLETIVHPNVLGHPPRFDATLNTETNDWDIDSYLGNPFANHDISMFRIRASLVTQRFVGAIGTVTELSRDNFRLTEPGTGHRTRHAKAQASTTFYQSALAVDSLTSRLAWQRESWHVV